MDSGRRQSRALAPAAVQACGPALASREPLRTTPAGPMAVRPEPVGPAAPRFCPACGARAVVEEAATGALIRCEEGHARSLAAWAAAQQDRRLDGILQGLAKTLVEAAEALRNSALQLQRQAALGLAQAEQVKDGAARAGEAVSPFHGFARICRSSRTRRRRADAVLPAASGGAV
jgi:hypothetical protein